MRDGRAGRGKEAVFHRATVLLRREYSRARIHTHSTNPRKSCNTHARQWSDWTLPGLYPSLVPTAFCDSGAFQGQVRMLFAYQCKVLRWALQAGTRM